MAVAAVTQTQILGGIHNGLGSAGTDTVWGILNVYGTMGNTDTGTAVALGGYGDKSIQVTGTFGTGGSCTLEGSNDLTNPTNWFTLTDPTGTAIAITSAGGKAVTEASVWIRPHVTAGDGTTALVVKVFCRNTQTIW